MVRLAADRHMIVVPAFDTQKEQLAYDSAFGTFLFQLAHAAINDRVGPPFVCAVVYLVPLHTARW